MPYSAYQVFAQQDDNKLTDFQQRLCPYLVYAEYSGFYVMLDVSNPEGIKLNRAAVRAALRALHNPGELEASTLIHLQAVKARQKVNGIAGSTLGWTLSTILDEVLSAMETIGQESGDHPEAHYGHILRQQYVLGKNLQYMARQFHLSTAQYSRMSAAALDAFFVQLIHLEQLVQRENVVMQNDVLPVLALPVVRPEAFIGRDEVLADLIRRLVPNGNASPSHAPVLSLYGLPGVGKTATVMELAYAPAIRQYFHDGVLWISLGRSPNLSVALDTWLQALRQSMNQIQVTSLSDDLGEHDGRIESKIDGLRRLIGQRRMLIVIDDVWAIQDARIAHALGSQCALVFTSRFPSVATELAGGNAIRLTELDSTQGLALLQHFVSSAPSVSADSWSALSNRVGGLPLALALMGRLLRHAAMTGQVRRLEQLLENLQSSRPWLELSFPTAPLTFESERPIEETNLRGVLSALDASLNDDVRQAWYALAVLPAKPNSFSEMTALTIAEISTETLDALVDFGILETYGLDRYTMHPVLRDYGVIWTPNEAKQRALDHFAQFASDHDTDYPALDTESDNILSMLADACGLPDTAGRTVLLAQTMIPYLQSRGMHETALTILRDTRDPCQSLADVALMIRHDYLLAQVLKRLGNTDASKQQLRKVIDLASRQQPRVTSALASAYEMLATISQESGDLKQTLDDYRHAYDATRDEGMSFLAARYLVAMGELQDLSKARSTESHIIPMGVVAMPAAISPALEQWLLGARLYGRGQTREARAVLLQGYELARSADHAPEAATIGGILSLAEVSSGWIAEGEAHAWECIHLKCQPVTGWRPLAFCYGSLGLVHAWRNDAETGIALMQHGLVELIDAGAYTSSAFIQVTLSHLLAGQGQDDRADEWAQRSLSLAQRSQQMEIQSYAVAIMSYVAARRGRWANADQFSREALATLSDWSEPQQRAYVHAFIGEGHLLAGKAELAQTDFEQAARYATQAYMPERAGAAYWGLARAALLEGNTVTSIRYVEEALRWYRMIGHMQVGVLERWLAELESSDSQATGLKVKP